ncbi:hypothetical protein [Vibrio tetraodonis]|uniref:hypothetical protein n=1 Tax=Vibrio tetraodonis TaxID=2231647 RepID=UPI0013B42C1C|nr:hypothetical protein [Vibrio tetraodonis]
MNFFEAFMIMFNELNDFDKLIVAFNISFFLGLCLMPFFVAQHYYYQHKYRSKSKLP